MKNKIILITGASSGIGWSTAKLLSSEGHHLILCGRNKKKLTKLSRELSSKNHILTFDVKNKSDVFNSISSLPIKFKKIDVLINNAGTNIPEHFLKVRKQDMEKVVKINTIAAFNVANLVALKMTEAKNRKKIGAAIINMSSQMGHVGGPIRSVYNMTKFGIEGLTKGMAIDLAKYNIRVNSIAPTFVVTPMTKKFFKNKNFRKEVLSNIPLGRYAELSEVSSAAVFLASEAASLITRTSLLVHGGRTAR